MGRKIGLGSENVWTIPRSLIYEIDLLINSDAKLLCAKSYITTLSHKYNRSTAQTIICLNQMVTTRSKSIRSETTYEDKHVILNMVNLDYLVVQPGTRWRLCHGNQTVSVSPVSSSRCSNV